MAEKSTREQATADVSPDRKAGPQDIDAPTPAAVDPGGAHAKGYSADPGSEAAVPDQDPIPLASGPDKHPAVRVPERDDHVQPTGRSEPHDYTSNDQLMGSD